MALVTWVFVALILLIVVVLLGLKITRGSATVAAPPVTPAPASVVQEVSSLPQSAFDQAGAPDPQPPLPLVDVGQPLPQIDGRAQVIFVGSEFCPYCAAARWALVAALARFGTFSDLGATSSSKLEVFPSTATFSFDGASYRSRYVTLSATEEYAQSPSSDAPAGFEALDTLPPVAQLLMRRFDPASSSASQQGVLPFIDVADRLVIDGSSLGFSPGLLQGSSMQTISSELSDPSSPVSRAVLGEANELSAAICASTGQQPRQVCDGVGVRTGAAELGLG